jgi:hypothetical protein
MDTIAIKFKSKDGQVVTFNVLQIIEIDGVPWERFTSVESVRIETDELLNRAVLDLQERVAKLEKAAAPSE